MGQLTLGEQAAPSTPASGVTVYTTVATPSILRVKDDGGNDWPIGAVLSGSWTPVFFGTSTAGTNTYSVQVGSYIKLGTLVMAWWNLTINTANTVAMVGNARVGGLPFTVRNLSGQAYSGSIAAWASLTVSLVSLTCRAVVNTTEVQLLRLTAAAASSASMPVGDLQNSSNINGVVVYESAS